MSMNLEEIMKPYFEKEEEINKNYAVRKNSLKLQLEKIRDNKESEIAEYLQNAVLDGRDFYSGYSAMIKEDLERAYAQKEKEIEDEINSVDKYYRVDVRELIELKGEMRKSLIAAKKELELKIMEAKINFDTIMFRLKTFKYEYDENHKVLNGNEFKELYEQSNILIEIKYGYEAQLKKLEEYFALTELTTEEIKIGMMSMTPWEKEEYDRRKSLKTYEETVVSKLEEEKIKEINSDEVEQEEKRSFELTETVKTAVEEQKKEIEEELFGDEEIPFSTSDEKEIEEESFEEPQIDELPLEEEQPEKKEEVNLEKIEEELNKTIEKELEEGKQELTPEQIIANDLIDSSINIEEEKLNIKLDEDYNVIADTYNDLLYHIFGDIADEAKKMRSIKIDESKGALASNSRYISTSVDARDEKYEVKGNVDLENSVQLPSGEYLNQNDIFKAIDKYRKANKGRTFTVNGKDYEINRKTARQLKKVLKECSTITLLKEKKITEFDMRRMVGKNLIEDGSKVDLGRVQTDLKTGNYINADEFLGNLRNLFEEKKTSWFKRTIEKFNSRRHESDVEVIDSKILEEIAESDKTKIR